MNEEPSAIAQVFKGLFATSTAGGSVYVSLLTHLETGLRIATLVAGLVATILTCVSLWRNLKRRKP
jgi:hypothetical protein